jgi:glutathione S-transferase
MSITLYYFPSYGRAEVTRMLLHSQGRSFIDNHIDDESLKVFFDSGKAEFGQIPCLEIDEKLLVESRAIERYLLTKAGTQTGSPYEGYLNDSTISLLEDIMNIIFTFIFVDNNLEGLKTWFNTDQPFYLRILNARVNEHGLFVGSSVQHADWAVFQFVWDGFLRKGKVDIGRPTLEAHAPKLITFAENFKNSDHNLSNYLESRPEQPY